MLEEARPGLPPDALRATELLGRDVERLRRLLERLSALARLEDGDARSSTEDVDLLDLIRRTIASSPYASEVTLESPGSHRVETDAAAIGQIVIILVENACVHGGGECRVALRSDDDGHHIRVSDDGPGVPGALAQVIFEPFAAARAGLSGRGSSLGLPLAYRLAAGIGADLSHDPSARRGASFELTLPR